jgi:hypothetical protein
MDKMYFLYLAIVALAFIFNIFLVTRTNDKDAGIAPILQMIWTLPILLISAIIFYFIKDNIAVNYYNWLILLPFLVEIIYFLFSKNLIGIFKPEGLIFRFYIYSIGLATIVVYCLNWIFVKIF